MRVVTVKCAGSGCAVECGADEVLLNTVPNAVTRNLRRAEWAADTSTDVAGFCAKVAQ